MICSRKVYVVQRDPLNVSLTFCDDRLTPHAQPLPTFPQAVAEKVRQLWNRVNLADRGLHIIFDAPQPNPLPIEQGIAGTLVVIPRLADRPDVADQFARADRKPSLALLGMDKLPLAGENVHHHTPLIPCGAAR